MPVNDVDKMGLKGLNPDGSTMNAQQRKDWKRQWNEKHEADRKSRAAAGEDTRPLSEKLGDENPDVQMKASQEANRYRENMRPEHRAGTRMEKDHVYDPGDSDGDGKAVSPSDENMLGGDPKSAKKDDTDPFKDTKAAWAKLTEVFGDKVAALQGELEGRLGEALTPTAREVNNPYAGDDVPASKEMTVGDVKAAAARSVGDAKAVMGGLGEIGSAATEVAGNAVREGTRATIKDMGYDPNEVGAAISGAGKTIKGLTGLFASESTNGGGKVPDGNWKPKSISDLFK